MKEWRPEADAAEGKAEVSVDHDPEVAAQRNGYEPETEPGDGAAARSACAAPGAEAPGPREVQGKAGLFSRQMDKWIASMERLRLSEYVRYVDDRKRLFWDHFWGGLIKGVGMAVGFTILGAVLVLILQNLAKRNLPLIGDALAQIVSIVQMRLK